ncbi:hypothetical protein IV102_33415 [bacterium]|nr:hypothetical protein [bacterium]
MNQRWHSWNQVEKRSRPEILDATLAELAADPHLPTPDWRQAQPWIELGRQLGVDKFEIMSLHQRQDLLLARDWLDQASASLGCQGLVVNLHEGCPWPHQLGHYPDLEVRWVPDSSGPDLTPCRRLLDMGLAVSLVVPEAFEMDPICLNRWVTQSQQVGVTVLEICGRRGAPWLPGIHSLLHFVRGILGRHSARLAWSSDHGFGLALSQALEAWNVGAQRVRGSLFGCGIQGNVPLELLWVNLELDQMDPSEDLTLLTRWCRYGEETFDLEVSNDHPVFGRDAFRSATDLPIHSSLSAASLGLTHSVEVGPLSGQSNLIDWLDRQGLAHDSLTLDGMLRQVQGFNQVLTDLELVDLYHSIACSGA